VTEQIPLDDLRVVIGSPAQLNGNTFSVLRTLCDLTNSELAETNSIARELTIRVLEHRDQVGEEYQELLASLVRAHGLFPYLDPGDLRNDADLLAYETHRPSGLDRDNIIFHRIQSAIYYHLLDGENVILSHRQVSERA
jgi:hypothetical protein